MSRLALFGGEMSVKGPIPRYNSIGAAEAAYVEQCVLGYPLSGYLGGRARGGHWVQRLEELWAAKFGVRHAIAVNSATSGLLAAARATELGAGDSFITTPFSMSATATAPSFFGAEPIFCDIDEKDFNIDLDEVRTATLDAPVRAVVVTNLFGCPAKLHELRDFCDATDSILIEDNAQGILATENGKYAGTIGHIGIFSLNVHKHIQCGEGGIIVTNDDALAEDMRNFINHGEMLNGPRGLNLRMPEVCAAIAVAQLDRVEEIVQGRIDQARAIQSQIYVGDWKERIEREGIRHVYYMLPFLYRPPSVHWPHRDRIVDALIAEGIPLVKGYVNPLNQLAAFKDAVPMPIAQDMHDNWLFQFSNCEWSPTKEQIEQFGDAVRKVVSAVHNGELK